VDSDDDDGEAKESDGEEVDKLKADAVSKSTSVDLEHIEVVAAGDFGQETWQRCAQETDPTLPAFLFQSGG
jgi:hypothetical protein